MPALPPEAVPGLVAQGASCRVDEDIAPRFAAGDAVICKNINPAGHTRLPRYLRGKRGVIDRDHGVFHFPDTNAHHQGETPQHVYSVRFSARELWGEDRHPRDSLLVDVWDDYLLADSQD